MVRASGAPRYRMKNPSPGSCFGGFGRLGDGTVPIGAALTTTIRRTPVASIAATMARVPREVMPASDLGLRGPSPDRTASAPATADASTAGSGAARSAVTMRTWLACPARLLGLRTTAVTSCPAATACSRSWRPMPPDAAKIVSFIWCLLLCGRFLKGVVNPPDLVLSESHAIRQWKPYNMTDVTCRDMEAQRRRRRLTAAVQESLRELRSQLSLFNRQIGASLDLKDVDMDCLDLINRRGPLSPGSRPKTPGCTPPPRPAYSIDSSAADGSPASERTGRVRRASMPVSCPRHAIPYGSRFIRLRGTNYMARVASKSSSSGRLRRRLTTEIKESLRELSIQLSLLNHRVGAHADLKDVDLDCLDLINRHGPLSPSALARRAGIHPATMTGILDRLERGGWVARERDPSDRRAVVVRAVRDRYPDLLRLYAGMNRSMNQIYAGYDESELELLADFLQRTANAGRSATDELSDNQ